MLPQTGERQVAETLDGIKPNHKHRYNFAINQIKALFGDNPSINIVDCACGIGYGTYMLATAFPEARVIGIDIHQPAVDAATRAYGEGNNRFQQADLSKREEFEAALVDGFDGEKQKVDVIVSIETIEHVKDDEALIQMYGEHASVLVGSVPNEEVVPFNRDTHPFHFRHYTKDEFTELLSKSEYTVKQWATQYEKIPGHVYDADDGMGFVVTAIQGEAVNA